MDGGNDSPSDDAGDFVHRSFGKQLADILLPDMRVPGLQKDDSSYS